MTIASVPSVPRARGTVSICGEPQSLHAALSLAASLAGKLVLACLSTPAHRASLYPTYCWIKHR